MLRWECPPECLRIVHGVGVPSQPVREPEGDEHPNKRSRLDRISEDVGSSSWLAVAEPAAVVVDDDEAAIAQARRRLTISNRPSARE